ncbi:hypothetical protein FB451DRAFT_1260247, partial [Mycena latifolia]
MIHRGISLFFFFFAGTPATGYRKRTGPTTPYHLSTSAQLVWKSLSSLRPSGAWVIRQRQLFLLVSSSISGL